MKPFNLEEAKAGKPVCTKSGRKARIICFDSRNVQPIVALIEDADNRYEITYNYDNHGKWDKDEETARDLMMVEEIDSLPNSWEEFCNNYSIQDTEYYFNGNGDIFNSSFRGRDFDKDKTLFRTKEQAEAMLAFIQLIRLRDVYRQGWTPNWESGTDKYAVLNVKNECTQGVTGCYTKPLTFQSEELRDLFFDNFKDLIEKAKEFI